MGMTREELEAAIGGEPGGGGMSLWTEEMEDDGEQGLATLEAEIASFDLEAEYDPESGCFVTATGVRVRGNTGVKVLFRRLPPKLTEQEFLEITGLKPSEYNYIYFRNPYRFKKYDPEARSVCFVNFIDPEMAEIYLEKFDGFLFVDRWGGDYYSTTTKAAYQVLPRLVSKIDPLEGTMGETEAYADFVRRYEAGEDMFSTRTKYEDGIEMCDDYLKELEERERNPLRNEASPLVEYFREQRKLDKAAGKRSHLIGIGADKFRVTRKVNLDCMNNQHFRNSVPFPDPGTRMITSERTIVPEAPCPTYEECYPSLMPDVMNSDVGQPQSYALNEASLKKWSSFSWETNPLERENEFTLIGHVHIPYKNGPDHSSVSQSHSPLPYSEIPETIEESQDKRKEDRRERERRDRKTKRLKSRSKFEDQKGNKERVPLKSVPEDLAESDLDDKVESLQKVEDEAPASTKHKKPSTPKESSNVASSSNSVTDIQSEKKIKDEKPSKTGKDTFAKSWELRPRTGGTRYGPNSFSKDSHRSSYFERKNEKADELNKNDEKSWRKASDELNKSDEKVWRNSSNRNRPGRGWDKLSKEKDFGPGRSSKKENEKKVDESTTNISGEYKKDSIKKSIDVKSTEVSEPVAVEKRILQREKISDERKTIITKVEKETLEIETSESSPVEKAPLKKVVKKIIRVRKPRGNDDTAEESKCTGTEGATTGKGAYLSRAPTSGSARSGKKPADSVEKTPVTSASGEASTKEKDVKPPANEDKEKRVRKARPDIQIYRPGSWRQKCPEKPGNGNGEGTTPKT